MKTRCAPGPANKSGNASVVKASGKPSALVFQRTVSITGVDHGVDALFFYDFYNGRRPDVIFRHRLRLTPKGFSGSFLVLRISSRSFSAVSSGVETADDLIGSFAPNRPLRGQLRVDKDGDYVARQPGSAAQAIPALSAPPYLAQVRVFSEWLEKLLLVLRDPLFPTGALFHA